MIDRPDNKRAEFENRVESRVALKMQARRTGLPAMGLGLGMMGLVGWSVVVPTLLGAAAGIWIDRHDPGQMSWTLALLVAGLVLGCFNAWNWVAKEDAAMHDCKGDKDE